MEQNKQDISMDDVIVELGVQQVTIIQLKKQIRLLEDELRKAKEDKK